jgi:Flp pilus assembly protein TadD
MKKFAALVFALVAISAKAETNELPIATCGEAAQMVSMIQEGRANGQTEQDIVAHIRSEDDISIREEQAAVQLVKFVYHNDTNALRAGNKLLRTCLDVASN